MVLGLDNDVLLTKLQSLQTWLLVAYAISLPLTMTGSWALLTAGIIAWGAEALVARIKKTEAQHQSLVPTPLPLKLPLIALAAAVALSGLQNPQGHGPLTEAWRCFWSLKAIIVYFWASRIFHSRPQVATWVFQSLLCVSAVAGIWGTIQQVANFHPFGYKYLQGTGFLSGPMPFAGQMQIFGMLSVALFLTGAYKQFSGKLSNKYVFAAIVTANLLGLLFAGERSAWLGGLAGAMVLAALVSWKLFFRSALIVAVLGAVSWYSIPLVHNRIEPMLSGQQDVGTSVRFRIWEKSIELWQKSPVFGVGIMGFPSLDIPEAIVPGVSKDLNHAHSNYLQFLCTTGIIGSLAYAWLCLAILIAGVKSYASAKQAKDELAAGYALGTLAAMISLMVSGLFEFNFGTAQVRLAQWLVLGLLAYQPKALPEQRRNTEATDSVPVHQPESEPNHRIATSSDSVPVYAPESEADQRIAICLTPSVRH